MLISTISQGMIQMKDSIEIHINYASQKIPIHSNNDLSLHMYMSK